MAARNRERAQNKLRMRQRSAGQSVVTSATYRAGEKLYSEYYGEVSDFTHKGGVVCADILLPPQAPADYQDTALHSGTPQAWTFRGLKALQSGDLRTALKGGLIHFLPPPVAEGGNALSAPDTPPPDMVKTVGGTTFDSYFHFSQTSRETFTDKVLRLIQSDAVTS